ncbi:MAG: hypothetical protein M1537_04115 [Nitrospirae bacterium]|nr:hypothetical protein [Nitrospirota bacterium]
MKEIRFAAGAENGLRSTVWKLYRGSDDIYLQSRMMGADTKISFHKSGCCQFSFTDAWVKKNINDRIHKNKDRHLRRWEREIPTEGNANLTFRLVIPGTEMCYISNETKLQEVKWLTLPQKDELLLVDFYFISLGLDRIESFPCDPLTCDPLIRWELADSSCFVGVSHIEKMTTEEEKILATSRLRNRTALNAENIPLLPQYRSSAFFTHELGFKGVIEMVP